VDALLREELDELTSRMCKALNDPKRLMLLYTLGEEPRTVSDLCEALELPQSNVSQHLAVLRDRGLVEATREGPFMVYRLRHPRVLDAIEILRQVMGDELARTQAFRARLGSPVGASGRESVSG
jgi:DNA-binding transcriptional ArsR family regulator